MAEHSNLIVEIGEWVMREVCRQARREVSDSGVMPAMMELELTESLLLDPQGMSEVLNAIGAMGVSLALDDFGTGYSSLSYLRRFPIHVLRIDRSFVSDVDHDANHAEMVKTLIGMAHNLRMRLVAEGVETEAQVQLLRNEGCEVAQGYYFSRPLPLAAFNALLLT